MTGQYIFWSTKNHWERICEDYAGVTSSSFCLNLTVKKKMLINVQMTINIQILNTTLKSFFVDDFISGEEVFQRCLNYL